MAKMQDITSTRLEKGFVAIRFKSTYLTVLLGDALRSKTLTTNRSMLSK